jgi:hypothetical protein
MDGPRWVTRPMTSFSFGRSAVSTPQELTATHERRHSISLISFR